MLVRGMLLTISAAFPVGEFISFVRILDAGSGEHHAQDFGTAAAIEIMQCVVGHDEVLIQSEKPKNC